MENEIKSVLDIIAEISKKDKKKQVFILTNLINQLKSTRIEANSNYEDCKLSYTRRTDNYIGNFKLMLFKKQLDCLDMIIENLDSYLDELLSSMDRAKIFQSVIKGTNVFTPIIDSYHTVGNHIIELSCSEKDNQHGLYNREVNSISFKGTYGVTVITNKGNGWERSIKLDKLCYSREEAMEYIKSLGDKEDEI